MNVKWISVKDRLPEKEGWYMVWYGRESCSYASTTVFSPRHQCWNCFDSFSEEKAALCRAESINRDVTHWMPMLPAPERSDDE